MPRVGERAIARHHLAATIVSGIPSDGICGAFEGAVEQVPV